MAEVLSSPTALIGSFLGVAAAAYGGFKKFSRGDREADAASDSKVDIIASQRETITKYSDLLDKSYERIRLADERTDRANQERNDLVKQLGEMTGEIARLRDEVSRLTREVEQLRKGTQ